MHGVVESQGRAAHVKLMETRQEFVGGRKIMLRCGERKEQEEAERRECCAFVVVLEKSDWSFMSQTRIHGSRNPKVTLMKKTVQDQGSC